MASFKIAHIKEQGVNLIIVPLRFSFGQLDIGIQTRIVEVLQDAAAASQLNGKVVPMWKGRIGTGCLAPLEWQKFFRTLKWGDVMRNLNRELICDEIDALGFNPGYKLSRPATGSLLWMLLEAWDNITRMFRRS